MLNKKPFYVVDIFAGAGGLSEGFIQAGFQVLAQVEMDKWACETLKTRHLYYALKRLNRSYLYYQYVMNKISRDTILMRFPEIAAALSHIIIQSVIKEDTLDHIVRRIKASMRYHKASRIHVLLGGPPCQSYSSLSRSRLDPERDKRSYLYKYYCKLVERLQPDFFVYENVPGLLSVEVKGQKLITRILADLSHLAGSYRVLGPHILNSADFGVPQLRKRVFIIGYKKRLEHRDTTLANLFEELEQLANKNKHMGYLTIKDAISDLPALMPGEGSEDWWGPYDNAYPALTLYQKEMRKDSPGILNHKAKRLSPIERERYRYFITYYMQHNKRATLLDLIRDKPELVPPYKHCKSYIYKYVVQGWDRPATTILASMYHQGELQIHPDITQCRAFTIREAARCQSFPDNYKFEGPCTAQSNQVGNAVPPLLAKAIGTIIRQHLEVVFPNS